MIAMKNFFAVSGLAAGLACIVSGCGSAPLSFLDGRPPNLLPAIQYPVRIVSVDGGLEFRNPVQVAPGPRYLVIEAAPAHSARGTTQRSFVFPVAPCTRYYLAAVRNSPMDAGWDLVVQQKEAVAGCNADEELKKAKASSTVESIGKSA